MLSPNRLSLTVMAMTLLAPIAWAASGGPDGGGYYWADDHEPGMTHNTSPPTSPPVMFTPWSDNSVRSIALPFAFRLYGVSSSTVYLSDNGWLSLQDPLGDSHPTPSDLPSPAIPGPVVAFFWDDLDPTGATGYHVTIDGGYQIVARGKHKSNGQVFMAYVELYEEGAIKIVYAVLSDPSRVSVGIQNAAGALGTALVSRGVPIPGYDVHQGSAVLFHADPGWDCVNAPSLACNQPTLTSSTGAGLGVVSRYPCHAGDLLGSEKVFKLHVPAWTRLDATLSNTAARQLGLVLLESCTPRYGCLAGGPSPLSFLPEKDEDFFLVVDGASSLDNGSFDLDVACDPLVASGTCNAAPVSGRTPGTAGFVANYFGPDGPFTYAGAEQFYKVSLPAARLLGAALTGSPDHRVLVADAATFTLSAPTYLAQGVSSASVTDAPAGDYFVVVEGLNPAADAFTLQIVCHAALPITPIACGDTVTGPVERVSFVRAHPGCGTDTMTAPEQVFRLDVPGTKDLVVSVDPASGYKPFLYPGPTWPASCIRTSDSSLGVVNASGSYLIAVDGPEGARAPFSLNVQCLNGLPTRPLPCDGTPVSDATGTVDFFGAHPACNTNPFTGGETFYSLAVPPGRNLKVDLVGSPDLTMFLYPAAGFPGACFKGTTGSLALLGAEGDYRLVVDALTGSALPYTITATCTDKPEVTMVSCGTLGLAGDASGVSFMDAYTCAPSALAGPEHAYKITVPPTFLLAVSVHDYTSAVAPTVVIAEAVSFDDGAPECITAGPGGAALVEPRPGEYLAIVETEPGAATSYQIDIQCGPSLDCASPAGVLECGQTVTGDTTTGAGRSSIYRSNPNVYSGPELVYSFHHEVDGKVQINLVGAPPELDLILLRRCDELAVVDWADQQLVETSLPAGDYFVVVDGSRGIGGAFSLQLYCAGATIQPDRLVLDLQPGDCATEHKVVEFPPLLTTVDVVLSIDLSGSMNEELNQVKTDIVAIVTDLRTLVPDLRFGLATFNDYAGATSDPVCGVPHSGGAADTPYRLNQPLTGDLAAMQFALSNVVNLGGAFETYTRTFYEACFDPAVGWRSEANKIWINFGDEIPQDCNYLACVGGTDNNGRDPGRDRLSGTPDDAVLLDVMDTMAARRISLMHVDSSMNPGNIQLWTCLAERTGGRVFAINSDGTIPNGMDIAQVIYDLVQGSSYLCDEFKLAVEPAFASWVASITPASYTNIYAPFRAEFDLTICVPGGTPPGVYALHPAGDCDGRHVAEQSLIIRTGPGCQIDAAVGSVPEICRGDTVVLNGAASTVLQCSAVAEYQWSAGATVVKAWSNEATMSAAPAVTTAYRLEVRCPTDPACTDEAPITVPVRQPPAAEAGAPLEICEGDTARLDASASSLPGCLATPEYQWKEAGTVIRPWASDPRVDVSPAAAQTYEVEVRCSDLAHCTARDTVDVTVKNCTTPVTFAYFEAVRAGAGVEVRWSTLREIDTLGFLVYGRDDDGAAAVALTDRMAPARGPGAVYTFEDAAPTPGRQYQIVEVALAGGPSRTPFFGVAEQRRSVTRGRGPRS